MATKRAGQLIERGKNVWLCRVSLGRDGAGKRQFVNHTIHGTKKDAQQWVTETLRNRDLGVAVKPAQETLSAYLDRWLEEIAKRKVKSKTFEGYRAILKVHVRPIIGEKPLGKVTTLDVQQVYNKMTDAKASPRTVQYTAMILKQALEKAVVWKMLVFNPCAGAELPRQIRREMKVFSPDQARKFLTVAKMVPQWGPLFSVALTTGMRPSEYLALKWSDIDLDRRTINVQRSIEVKSDGTWKFSDLKTAKSRRTIRLHTDVAEALKEHRARQERRKVQALADPELVFSTRNGTPHGRNNVKRAFRWLIAKVKLPVIRLYDLRHTAATLSLAAGVDLKRIQEMLGHSNAALTLNTYSHVLPGGQAEASDKVEALLRGEVWHTGGTQAPSVTSTRVS